MGALKLLSVQCGKFEVLTSQAAVQLGPSQRMKSARSESESSAVTARRLAVMLVECHSFYDEYCPMLATQTSTPTASYFITAVAQGLLVVRVLVEQTEEQPFAFEAVSSMQVRCDPLGHLSQIGQLSFSLANFEQRS